MKLVTSFDAGCESIQKDLIEIATEACCDYTDALAAGHDLKELDHVVDNVIFCKQIIETRGLVWFTDNCDNDHSFAKLFGIQSALKEHYISAAQEGLTDIAAAIWDKIKEWWTKLVNWIKSLFTKDDVETSKENIEKANKELSEVKDLTSKATPAQKDHIKNEIKTTEVSQKSLSTIASLLNRLRNKLSFFNKDVSTEALKYNTIDFSIFKTIDGLPTAKALINISNAGVNLESKFRFITNDLTNLLNQAKDAKTQEQYDILTNNVDRIAGDILHSFFGWKDMFVKGFECVKPDGNENISLGAIGINSDTDVANFCGKMSNTIGSITHIKESLLKLVKLCEEFEIKRNFDEKDNEFVEAVRRFKSSVIATGTLIRNTIDVAQLTSSIQKEMTGAAVDIALAYGNVSKKIMKPVRLLKD